MSDPRLPVTLLTGFLGAGKTTLLNALLGDASVGRMAVIVNEYGEAGLDQDLIAKDIGDVTLMQSGCLCCTLRDDLASTIGDLLQRRDAEELAFDRLVIETTGLADPGPILQTLRRNPVLSRCVRMDGVVTVADAANGPATLDAQFEAVSQAAMADLIVLSKTDLVAPEQVIQFEERLRGINPTAQILHAPHGTAAAGRIAGVTGLRSDAAPADVLAWTTIKRAAPPDPFGNLTGLIPDQPVGSGFSPHDGRIGSASIVLDRPITDRVFDGWVNELLDLRGPNILRIKGLVFLEDMELPFVFHGVQHIFEPPVPLKTWSGGDRKSRIVVIARDLSDKRLQRSLDMLWAAQRLHDQRTPQTAT